MEQCKVHVEGGNEVAEGSASPFGKIMEVGLGIFLDRNFEAHARLVDIVGPQWSDPDETKFK